METFLETDTDEYTISDPLMDEMYLPRNIKSFLSADDQCIFDSAYRRAYEEYVSPGRIRGYLSERDILNRMAWASIKVKYKKVSRKKK